MHSFYITLLLSLLGSYVLGLPMSSSDVGDLSDDNNGKTREGNFGKPTALSKRGTCAALFCVDCAIFYKYTYRTRCKVFCSNCTQKEKLQAYESLCDWFHPQYCNPNADF
ncbi:uncharacterized protein LOC144441235 [Glandiceps talaboti]